MSRYSSYITLAMLALPTGLAAQTLSGAGPSGAVAPAAPVASVTGAGIVGVDGAGAQGLGLQGTLRPSLPDVPVEPVGGLAPPPGDGVQPPPKTFGIFTITPGVTSGSYFDDNVFASSSQRRSDVAFFTRPEVSAAAGGANYGFQSSAFVEGRKYATYTSEDQVNAGVSASGVVQVEPDTQLRGQVDYQHAHEDRGSGESAFIVLDRPVAFDQISGAAAVNHRFDQNWVSLGGAATGVFYQNATLLGLPINETYRNVAIPTATARVGHVVAPLTSVFVDVTGNAREFDYAPLSSNGYRAAAGLLFEPGPGARMKGEAFAGYMHQDYRGAGLQTVDSWTYGVAMNFLLTDVLTLAIDGRREAKETPLFDGSLVQNQLGPTGGLSLIESSIGGRFDYQIMPGLVASAGATFISDDFQGTQQEDRYVSPLASLNYALSKHITIGLDYRRLEYRPDIVGVFGFQKDVVLGTVHAVF